MQAGRPHLDGQHLHACQAEADLHRLRLTMHLKPYQVSPFSTRDAFHLVYNNTNIRKVLVHHRFNELQRMISVLELNSGAGKVKGPIGTR